MAARPTLGGWRIRRVDGPAPGLYALTLRGPDAASGALLLALGPADWALAEERPRGAPASSFVQLLRKHLGNAVIEELRFDDDGLALRARRGPREATLRLRTSDDGLELEPGGAGRTLSAPRPAVSAGGAPRRPRDLQGLRAHGAALARRALGAAPAAERAALAKAIRRRVAKLRRRGRKIAADRARAAQAPELRARASALLAELHRLPADADEVEVTDWSASPPRAVRVTLSLGRTPQQEAEHLFARARKLERGATIARERAALTEREIAALEALRADLDEGAEALATLGARAAALGVRPPGPPARAASAPQRQPHREFRGAGDRRILVGRSARDNDALTLGAKPWDLWLHARGVPGSHVVVPLGRGEDCPAELLADAAHLAVHYSQLRGEARVEVAHTARRYVRKPRGSAPGAVRLEGERVILLEVERTRLERLLRSERAV